MWKLNLLLIDKESKNLQNKHRGSALNFTFTLGCVGLFNSFILFSWPLGLLCRLCIQEIRLDGHSKPIWNWSLHYSPGSHGKDLHVRTTHTAAFNAYPSVWKWEHLPPSPKPRAAFEKPWAQTILCGPQNLKQTTASCILKVPSTARRDRLNNKSRYKIPTLKKSQPELSYPTNF